MTKVTKNEKASKTLAQERDVRDVLGSDDITEEVEPIFESEGIPEHPGQDFVNKCQDMTGAMKKEKTILLICL